jgi:hypothetical protein
MGESTGQDKGGAVRELEMRAGVVMDKAGTSFFSSGTWIFSVRGLIWCAL